MRDMASSGLLPARLLLFSAFDDGSAHCAHLVLGGARMGSGANHKYGRAVQRREVVTEFAVDGVHLDHDVRGLGGRHFGRAPSAARMRMTHPNRRNWVRTFSFPVSSNMAIG